MDLQKIVGKDFYAHLTDADKYPVLVIGKDRWSFQAIANEIGVAQTKACRILSTIAKEMKVKDTKDLYKQTSPYILAGLKGCGVTTLYVALQVFAAMELDVDKWYIRGEKEAIITFQSLKIREQKAEHRTKEAERKRRRLRSTKQLELSVQ